MIYLENKTLLQDVYIPRQDMLPYTTGSSGTYAEGYSDGYEDGTQDQKDKLASTAFTENGLYTREDGWNEVEVSVEAPLPVLEDKTVVISADTTTVTPSSGYDGMSQVIVDASGYAQENYDGGFEDGFEDGYSSGSTDEKAKLSGVTFTVNTAVTVSDGGYSAVTVNVPQTGHTDQELEDAYESGYTSGQTDQKNLLTTTAFTENGSYQRENGWSGITVNIDTASTYNSGYTDGYDSGYTSGETHQKSLLVSTAFTENGNYTRENGYSAITVNVPTGQTYNVEENHPFTATSNGNYTITPSSGQTTKRIGYEDGVDFYFTASTYPSVGYFEIGTIEFYDRDDESIGSVDIYYDNDQIGYDNSNWNERIYTGVTGNNMLYIGFNEDDYSDYVWREGEDFSFNYDVMSAVSLNVNVDTASTYQSGYTDGQNNIIGTFSSMTATTNGVYGSSAHPLSSITVNVPQSGGSGTTKIFFADYIHTETLQADSRDRINTGIYPTTATTFRVKGLGKGLSAGYELVGFDLNDAGEESDYRLFCYSTSGEILGFDWYSERITNENWGGLTDGKSIDFTCSNYQVYDNINETVLISGSPQSNMAQGIPIYVNVGSWWLKGLEIWEGNTKVFDGVAAYDDSGNIGLYDSVSNALVTNTGLTMVYEFDSGSTLPLTSISITANTAISVSDKAYTAITVNVPQISAVLGTKLITSNGTYSATTDSLDGYSAITVNVSTGSDVTYVEYLETDGSEISWDTGVKITDLDEVVYFDFAPLTGTPTGDAFFAFLSQQQNDFYWTLAIRTNVVYRFDSVITQFGNKSQYINYTEGVKNTCILSKTGATVNGVDYQTSSSSVSTTSWNIIINGQKNNDGPVFMRFPVARYYGFKIMSGETAVIDLKPALDGNNVPCFYDEISKTYIYHSGSGTPIAGPIVHYSDYMSGFTDGYASGFTDGYNSGLTDGYASGYTDGYASGLTDGYASGFTDGYASGYTDGYNSGYTSGYTDGQNNIIGTFSSMTATTNGVYGSSANPLSSITVDVQTADYGELIGLYCTNNCQFVITPATTTNLINTEIAFGIRSGNASMKITSGASLPNANRIIVDNNGNVTGNSYSYDGSGGVSTGSGQTSVVLNSFPNKNYMYIDRNGVNSINYVNSLSASTCNNYSSTPGNNMLLSIDDGYFYIGYFNAQNAYETAACLFPNVDTDGNACILGNNGLFYPINGECYPIYKNGNNYYVLMKSQPWNQQ